MEHAIDYTREPLQLSFRVKPGNLSAHIILKCSVTNVTNYNILIGHQIFYPLEFDLDI